ncbi:leucine-rich repeat and calponin homology domain-containing protein-like isoform X2 [Ornithodoros turicata]|uniref:leucine-rich repeat and calponin homology domain-containing protein-like isoform X2 n=1 Tax=Ornithodoros turicata TaxID=34597 RepID=UPI003139423E
MATTALGTCQNSNQQLTRTLERVFEEAQVTGELRLNGRKLKDFPKFISKYDLADTVLADLSKNRFHELPLEICMLFLLEKLDCYHNLLRVIPSSVSTLQSLSFLNLSRNQLRTIPAALCQLPLEVLLLSNNRLVSLPEEIGQMKCLMELDASCNELTLVPVQIGEVVSLRSLSVRHNLLVELPQELCSLKLVTLDVAANRITFLPPALRLMTSLQGLHLDQNPLTSPPAFLCSRGKVHVFKYLEIQAIKEDRQRGTLLAKNLTLVSSRPELHYQNGHLMDGRQKRYTVDSGYNTSEGGDKRWSQGSQELSSDVEEGRQLAVRAAEATKEQRHERWRWRPTDLPENTSPLCIPAGGTPSTLSPGSEVCIDDTFAKEMATSLEEEEVAESPPEEKRESPENRANHIVRRHSTNGGPPHNLQTSHVQTYREFKEALKQRQRLGADRSPYLQRAAPPVIAIPPEEEFRAKHDAIVNHQRNETLMNQGERPDCATQQNSTSPQQSPQRLPKSEASSLHVEKLRCSPCSSPYKTPPRMTPPRQTAGFTIRRGLEKAREEQELVERLRWVIESRLKVSLPEDLAASLTDGVVLCHLANQVRARSVASVHVPSPSVPTLTMAKRRRNVDNFLGACRQLGVPEEVTCSAQDILEGKGLVRVAITVEEIFKMGTRGRKH